MALTTTTTITTPVDVVFQTTLLRNAKAMCPYFEGTEAATVAEHAGTFTAKWRRIENLSVPSTALTELTGSLAFPTRTADQPTVTDITATVSKFGNFIYLNEEVDLGNYSGQTDKLMEVLGINAGQALNRQQRNEMEDNSTQLFAGAGATTATAVGIGDSDAEISASIVAKAVNDLNNQEALKFAPMSVGSTNIGSSPIRDAYLGFVHVDVEEDLRAIGAFIEAQQYGSHTSLYKGEIGQLGGVRFISTTEASIDASSGATVSGTATAHHRSSGSNRTDVYNAVVMGRDAVGSLGFGFEHVKSTYMAGDNMPGVQMISHQRGSAGSADPLNEVSSLGWKSWHAAKILNSNWIRGVKTASNKLDTA
jgi:N4-gp56 family major capsid protein